MRPIDADRLKELVSELIPRHSTETEYGQGRVDSYKFVLKVIDNAPTVEVDNKRRNLCTTCKDKEQCKWYKKCLDEGRLTDYCTAYKEEE